MARKAIQIKDRIATSDDVFLKTELPDGKIKLSPDPDNTITESGTDVNKYLMQPWEDIHKAVSGRDDDVQLRTLYSGRVVRITAKGDYSSTEIYDKYDHVVSEQGYGFVSKKDGILNTAPPQLHVEDDNWKPFFGM